MTRDQPVATGGTGRTGTCAKMCQRIFQKLKQKLARLRRADFEYFTIIFQGVATCHPLALRRVKFDANLEGVKRNLKFVKQDGKIEACVYV